MVRFTGEKLMGISTTGFVLTENKDVFEVLNIIENTLIELVRKYTKEFPIFRDKTSKLPVIECSPAFGHFRIFFKINDEDRMLVVHFDCDGDYKEYGDSKIIWSVNYWGLAEEIVLGICEAMKQYGKVFYEANDCDGDIVEV
jgi:hypothetical protein